ncbi:MAG: hypothetical protein J6B87_05375 [Clostridia bacterium]|nr:hypothetical protein [Clostridia bacterium]
MKNLIEELQKLNNEENYNVPSGFRQKVMNRIENDSSNNIIKFKYIIPILSSAAVILVAAIFVGKTGNLERQTADNDSMLITDGMVAESIENDRINSAATGINMFDKYIAADNAPMAELKTESAVVKDYSQTDFYNEIVDMFKTNDIEAKVDGKSVKAKCTKSKAEEVLFYYEGQITITVEGEYVIVK